MNANIEDTVFSTGFPKTQRKNGTRTETGTAITPQGPTEMYFQTIARNGRMQMATATGTTSMPLLTTVMFVQTYQEHLGNTFTDAPIQTKTGILTTAVRGLAFEQG